MIILGQKGTGWKINGWFTWEYRAYPGISENHLSQTIIFRFYVNLGGVGMLSLTSCRWDVEISTPNLGSFYRPERPRDLVVSGVRRLVRKYSTWTETWTSRLQKNYSLEKCVSLKLPPKHNKPHQLWIKIYGTTHFPPAFARKANGPDPSNKKSSRHWLRHWWKMSILGSLELCGVLESELGRGKTYVPLFSLLVDPSRSEKQQSYRKVTGPQAWKPDRFPNQHLIGASRASWKKHFRGPWVFWSMVHQRVSDTVSSPKFWY